MIESFVYCYIFYVVQKAILFSCKHCINIFKLFPVNASVSTWYGGMQYNIPDLWDGIAGYSSVVATGRNAPFEYIQVQFLNERQGRETDKQSKSKKQKKRRHVSKTDKAQTKNKKLQNLKIINTHFPYLCYFCQLCKTVNSLQ